MTTPLDWKEELKFVVGFMRELSQQTDPQIAANLDRIIAEHSALGWDAPVSGAMRA